MSLLEYLLIECREREISTPAAFGTHKEAHDEMCKWVAAVLGVGIEGVIESYLAGVEYASDTCICRDNAWTERHGQNFDWKIFTRNDAGEYI